MGCPCSKQGLAEEDSESPKEKVLVRPHVRRVSGSARVETTEALIVSLDKETDQPRVRNKQNGSIGALALRDEVVEKRRERQHARTEANPKLSNIPRHVEGEQVAAGWPAWLSAVAGEVIKGWIPRRADSFEKLDKIGQGTYSNVYKARDLDSGRIVALKKVRFDNLEPESVRFMAREIQVLRRLDHPNVVKLDGLVTSRMSCSLYLVFEYMEHDLAGLAACPGIMFTEAQVKCYLQQLLRGLDHCHTRGVLHRDIKGSNLLLDNSGNLKIADFGLATFFHPDQKQALTSRVVTLWYRPPELLLGATDYAVGVDLWSTGCILAELLAGKPIMPGRTEVEQLHKIFKLCGSPSEEYWKKSKLPHATIFKPQQPYKRGILETFKDFPASALALLDTLLAIEPGDRGTASAALKSEFFTTKPYACDPASLPQYPPSKEFDAKLRDEEARRQRAAGGRGLNSEVGRRQGARDRSKAVPAPDANAELPISLQRRIHAHSSKSKSEKFAPVTEDTAVGFPIEPPKPGKGSNEVRGISPVPPARPVAVPASSRSGPQMLLNQGLAGSGWGKKLKEEDLRMAPPRPPARTSKSITMSSSAQNSHGQQEASVNLPNFSSSVAARHQGTGNYRRDRVEARQREQDGNNELTSYKRNQIHGNAHEHLETSKQQNNLDSSAKQEQTNFQQVDATSNPEAVVHLAKDSDSSHGPEFINGLQDRDIAASFDDTIMDHEVETERMYHSGPLLRQGYSSHVDIEELLDNHDRQLQRAARKAAQGLEHSRRLSSPVGEKNTSDHKAMQQGQNDVGILEPNE
ncbi:hypothetical protein O6H91_19G069400 [Diphasiastrum complanatum]|uniref:Uncharacterized protein n=1 Tax=Diphasiastrum complanatum TaxID=34168 RepID=A0ACC2AWC7_DIPCM|nr:hypothetical protein O6H91_19G069400 [Diphasiastrum complanatum]